MKTLVFLIMILGQILPKEAKTQIHSDTLRNSSYAFKREVPKLKNGKHPTYYLNKRNVEGMMGLRSLENGFDSLQLRFWYGYARTDSSQLIILSRKDMQWSAQLFTIVYIASDDGKMIKSLKKSEKPGYPKSGWERFIKALFDLSIPSLPDENSIKNYPEYADGSSVIIEVATKSYYRIYSYREPMQAQARIEDAKRIEKALTLIEEQLDFKRLRKF